MRLCAGELRGEETSWCSRWLLGPARASGRDVASGSSCASHVDGLALMESWSGGEKYLDSPGLDGGRVYTSFFSNFQLVVPTPLSACRVMSAAWPRKERWSGGERHS